MYFGEKSANEKRNSAMSMCTFHIQGIYRMEEKLIQLKRT